MKRLLLLVLLLSGILAAQTTTVSGDFKGSDGTPVVTGASVRFDLQNCPAPRIVPSAPGTLVITKKEFIPGALGVVSGNILRTDKISCNGAYTALWAVTYYVGTIPSSPAITYQITAPFNLNTPPQPSKALPIAEIPVVIDSDPNAVHRTGDETVAGDKTFTGVTAFTNKVTVPVPTDPNDAAAKYMVDAKANKTITVNGQALSSNVTITPTTLGLGNVDNTSDVNKPVSNATQLQLNLKEYTANKGQASGYAPLDGSSKVPTENLPPLPQSKTCSSTDKINVYDAATGLFACAGDQTGAGGGGVTSLNGSVLAVQTFSNGTGITVSTNAGTGVHTITFSGDKSTVGLGNVDNTSDANKPVSTAQATAIGLKADKTTTVNGHALSSNVTVSKSDVGLGNADNTSDANKPVSTAQAAADALKVDKTITVNGQPLSANVNITTITGNAGTATALAANGSNCPASQVAAGVDAGGNAESCYDLAPLTVRQAIYMFGSKTGVVLADGDGEDSIWINRLGRSVTINEVTCDSDNGVPLIQLTNAGTNILSGSGMYCSSTPGVSTSWNGGNNVVANGAKINFSVVTAGGVAKRVTIVMRYQ